MQDIVREGRMIISNIERVSALYLTKTIYSVLLNVIFIIIGRAYPFVPIHLSLISAAAIGLPSFFLALEQTETVTQDGFLKECPAGGSTGSLGDGHLHADQSGSWNIFRAEFRCFVCL